MLEARDFSAVSILKSATGVSGSP